MSGTAELLRGLFGGESGPSETGRLRKLRPLPGGALRGQADAGQEEEAKGRRG